MQDPAKCNCRPDSSNVKLKDLKQTNGAEKVSDKRMYFVNKEVITKPLYYLSLMDFYG